MPVGLLSCLDDNYSLTLLLYDSIIPTLGRLNSILLADLECS
jgi:hypothetical protein